MTPKKPIAIDPQKSAARCVFLDRDGVLIRDIHLLTRPDQIEILPGVPEALARLASVGFQLVVVSNQAVVARGLCGTTEVALVHDYLAGQLAAEGARIDAWYFCPHHPEATLAEYRTVCNCRKPEPGMLQAAARERQLDLSTSFLVGDRPTDVVAGQAAGCRAVFVQTGRHLSPAIRTTRPLPEIVKPEHTCADLSAAADWILRYS